MTIEKCFDDFFTYFFKSFLYISSGVVLSVNGMDYFALLSSFKPKHNAMRDGIDFIKIKNYAVIHLNNMFRIAPNTYSYVDISAVKNEKYKELLRAEYRYIKSIQERIRKNALTLYKLWLKDGKLLWVKGAMTSHCLKMLVKNQYSKSTEFMARCFRF